MQLTSLSLALTRAGFLSFSPASLFAAGEPGVWYEPSLTNGTCFQDSSGTTPVTAVEQPVGLILDKSKGLVLGPELVTNGDFSDGTTGWSDASTAPATTIISDGVATLNSLSGGTARLRSTARSITTAGKAYKIEYNYSGSGSVYLSVGTTSGGFDLLNAGVNRSGFFLATGTTVYISFYSAGAVLGTIDNISVRELPGNHAFQTTSTSRPVLSARVNLLTKTEKFDDAVWVKSNSTITANVIVAPDGTLTADKITETAVSGAHLAQQQFTSAAATYALTCYLKAAERSIGYVRAFDGSGRVTYFDLANGTVLTNASGNTASIVSVGDGWYRCSVVSTFLASASALIQVGCTTTDNLLSYTGDGTSGIYIWGASLVPANQVSLPYQRVNTSTDYDATGFPLYLKFDGVDDFLVTNSINFTATDKMTVFAGVRKLSDAAVGVLAELSVDPASNNGSWSALAPATVGATYRFGSKGSTAISIAVTTTSYAAPVTNVFTGVGDISGDTTTIRVNGAQAAQSTADQGTGNYGNYPLYIGRRGGTTLPFNGHLYSLIVRGAQSSAGQIASAETWVNSVTKAY